jgi:uncharacterized protein
MKHASLAIVVFILFTGFATRLSGQISPEIKLTRYVTDSAGFLSDSLKEVLEYRLDSIYTHTSRQIVLFTTTTLDGLPIEDFSNQLFNFNHLGKTGDDKGVLVVMVNYDHKVRIEVGYGLEPFLPDIACSRIINNIMVPCFKKDSFETGILKGIDAIDYITANQLKYEEGTKIKGEVEEGGSTGVWMGVAVIVAIFFVVGYLLVRRCDPVRTRYLIKVFTGQHSVSWFLDYLFGSFVDLLIGVLFMSFPTVGIALTRVDYYTLTYSDVLHYFLAIFSVLVILKLVVIPVLIVWLFKRKPLHLVWHKTNADREYYKKYSGRSGSGSFGSSGGFSSHSSSSDSSSIGGGGSSGGGGASGEW